MNSPAAASAPRAIVHLITADRDLPLTLTPALAATGLRLEWFASAEHWDRRWPNHPAGALIVDLRQPVDLLALRQARDAASGVADTPPRHAEMPLLCITPDEADIDLRLMALRAGAHTCLSLRRPPGDWVETLLPLVAREPDAPGRILIVDDQPVAALFAARILEGAGWTTERAEDPLRVPEILERFAPDLILMDLHMPGANGLELTALIRAHERFGAIPILFLSGELDGAQQLAALRVGGDDFLAKPVAPDRLLACVAQRWREARARASRTHRWERIDHLTGLATREVLLQRLDRLIGYGDGAELLLYLEVDGDEEALARLGAVLNQQLPPGTLAARVALRAIAILLNAAAGLSADGLCQALQRQIGGPLPRRGACPLALAGGDALTLISRAATAARQDPGTDPDAIPHYRPQATLPAGAVTAPEAAAARRLLIREAAAAGRFELLFEPIMPLNGPVLARFEVHPRLRLDNGEWLSPADYLPALHGSDQLDQADLRVWDASLEILRLLACSEPPLCLLVPQRLGHLCQPAWSARIAGQLASQPVLPCPPLIQIQVASRADDGEGANGADRLGPLAAQLERLGLRLCLDGFDGSRLARRALIQLPIDSVRLARTSLTQLGPSALAESVRWIQTHGIQVIAGGLDSPEAILTASAAGVDLLQGPFIQPPGPGMAFDFVGS